MAKFALRGVIPCLLTPFDVEGNVLPRLLADEIRFLESAGVDAVCVGGAASELAGSAPEEFGRVCALATAAATGPVIAAIHPDSTPEAVALAHAAVSAGVAALLIAQPHYLFQPDSNGLEEFFRVLRRHIPVPIALSNSVPNAAADPSAIGRLTRAGLIDGVHQGCDAHVLADLLCTSPRLPVLAGLDDLMYVALLLGAECIVSSLAALFPEECTRLYNSVLRSEHDAARRIHERTVRLWRALDDPVEFAARMKYTSNALHRPIGIARSPYDMLPNASQAKLVRALAAEGFL